MADELGIGDAAAALGLSRQRLALLAKQGRLGRQVAGRYWVFTREEIEAYKPKVKASKGGRPRKSRPDPEPLPPDGSGEEAAAPPPAVEQAILVALIPLGPAHLTLDGASTLCGHPVQSSARRLDAFPRRERCGTCMQVASERGIHIVQAQQP